MKGEAQNSAVDWWTFGILCYEMMTGATPFRAKTSEEVLKKITSSDRIHWDADVGSSEARKVVKKLLKRDPKKRLGAEHGATEIKKSPWFSTVNFSLIRNEDPPIIPTNVPSLADFEGVDMDRDEQEARDDEGPESDPEDNPVLKGNSTAFADFDMQREDTDNHKY